MRPANWAMRLTVARIALVPVFVALLMAGGEWRLWALVVFGIMALTDVIDGQLARRMHQTSRAGELLDPLADKLLVICSVVLLALPQYGGDYCIPIWVVAFVIAKDFVTVAGSAWLILRMPRARITARLAGKLSTFFQIAMVLLTLIAPLLASSGIDVMGGLIALWWTVAIFAGIACLSYIRSGARQYYRLRGMLRAGGSLRIAAS